ncbi:MAG TPA: alcohol dehydrogenase [Anaerolineae bacterium]|nr:alcohol dehydrogenase [Anaerolineae bacterium]
MRQIWITETGGPDVLKMQETADPIPRNGEVRIRVEAVGVSFMDVLCRKGVCPGMPATPLVPGFEIAGTIDQVSQGVGDLKEGEQVFALTRFGGYSDVVCVPHKQVFRRLDWMPVEEAAALPVNYLLAYQMLVVMGSLHAGDAVLIHQVDRGVGLAALDVATILGADTFGTAPLSRHELLRSRGLAHVVDVTKEDFERVFRGERDGRGLQIILDSLGGVYWPKNYRLLMPTGRLINYGLNSMSGAAKRSRQQWLRGLIMLPYYTPLKLMRDNKGVMGVDLNQLWSVPELQQRWMQQLVDWYDEVLFRPLIDKAFPLAEAAAAHQYLLDRQGVGKVLLIP